MIERAERLGRGEGRAGASERPNKLNGVVETEEGDGGDGEGQRQKEVEKLNRDQDGD